MLCCEDYYQEICILESANKRVMLVVRDVLEQDVVLYAWRYFGVFWELWYGCCVRITIISFSRLVLR